MLKIFINTQKERLILEPEGQVTEVPLVLAYQGNICRRLQNLEVDSIDTLAIWAERRYVFFKRIFPFRFRYLPISQQLERGIIRFITKYQGREHSFDCYAFVNDVHGVEQYGCAYLKRFWWTVPKQAHPKVGNTLFLLDEKRNRFIHAAIYIGYGYYISVYGLNGDLEIATLSEMVEAFDAKDIVHVIPALRTRAT